jgi:hypothetical protein
MSRVKSNCGHFFLRTRYSLVFTLDVLVECWWWPRDELLQLTFEPKQTHKIQNPKSHTKIALSTRRVVGTSRAYEIRSTNPSKTSSTQLRFMFVLYRSRIFFLGSQMKVVLVNESVYFDENQMGGTWLLITIHSTQLNSLIVLAQHSLCCFGIFPIFFLCCWKRDWFYN